MRSPSALAVVTPTTPWADAGMGIWDVALAGMRRATGFRFAV